VPNGGFEQGNAHPDHWFVKLTDFKPKKETNAEGFISYRYICACGKDLGNVQPYIGLFCPQCKGFLSGEEAGAWYVNNDKCVSLDNGKTGRAVKFTLPKDVGENQGVRIFSALIPAKLGWGYILEFDVKTHKSLARVFVECYREVKVPRSFLWDGGYAPNAPKVPIERVYRCPVNCGSSPNWQHFKEPFPRKLPLGKSYQFNLMAVKLYAYMPGEAWFDNVVLRPMTEREMAEHTASTPRPTDKRFER
jgi:hypothetical protein